MIGVFHSCYIWVGPVQGVTIIIINHFVQYLNSKLFPSTLHPNSSIMSSGHPSLLVPIPDL